MDRRPTVANADQADANMNMVGDACEAMGAPDEDRDGRPDAADNCPRVWNVNQADDDHDGLGNVYDPTPGRAALPGPTAPLARAFAAGRTRSGVRPQRLPATNSTGTWRANCEHGGTVEWNVSLSGLSARSTASPTRTATTP
ncbi:MAG: thrombospondin type 3 repeat-containing protein [Polyangiales bacterium]